MSFANKSIEKGNPLGETFLESKERKKVFILLFFREEKWLFDTRGCGAALYANFSRFLFVVARK